MKIDALSLCIIIIYRPPPNAKNGFTFNEFMEDMSSVLELKMSASEKLLTAGDFNIRIDDTSLSNTTRFMDMLDALGLFRQPLIRMVTSLTLCYPGTKTIWSHQ